MEAEFNAKPALKLIIKKKKKKKILCSVFECGSPFTWSAVMTMVWKMLGLLRLLLQ